MLSINKLKEMEIAIVRASQGGHLVRQDAGNLAWEPYEHGSLGLWNGVGWELVTPSGENVMYTVSSGTDINNDSFSADTNYDVYAHYSDLENIDLVLAPWNSNTSREHGPERFQGILVYDKDDDEGRAKRYLGSIRLNSSVELADSDTQRFIANWDHPVPKAVVTYNESTSNWSRSAWSYIEYRGGSNQVRGELLNIFEDASIWGNCGCWADSNTNMQAAMCLGLNETLTEMGPGGRFYLYSYSNYGRLKTTSYSTLRVGYNYVTILYKSYGGNVNMYNGDWGGGSAMFYG